MIGYMIRGKHEGLAVMQIRVDLVRLFSEISLPFRVQSFVTFGKVVSAVGRATEPNHDIEIRCV
jgi:hypothetical protein